MVVAHLLTSTRILPAIPLPMANSEPLTLTSRGPLKGADLTTVTFVPGVRPKSLSLLVQRSVMPCLTHRFLALCPHICWPSELQSVVVITPVSPFRKAVKGKCISSLCLLQFS